VDALDDLRLETQSGRQLSEVLFLRGRVDFDGHEGSGVHLSGQVHLAPGRGDELLGFRGLPEFVHEILLGLFVHAAFLELADDVADFVLVDLAVRFGCVDHGPQDELGAAIELGFLRSRLGLEEPERDLRLLLAADALEGFEGHGAEDGHDAAAERSAQAFLAAEQSAGVKENNIIVWDRTDREVARAGLTINKGATGVRAYGTSTASESILPWVEGYDRDVFVSFEDGTLKKYRELVKRDFTKDGSYREIFNSVAWLWMLAVQGNEKAKKYGPEMRRLYADYSDWEGIKKIAEEVAGMFDDVTIPDEDKSFFSTIVTKDITKLVNIGVLKHNEDSGLTWAAKNIALGVTTNKVRFHIDYCAKAIPEILAKPCLKDKTVLHIGEAAKISVVSVAGAQIAYDNRIFFSRDPVAMDRVGLDILEAKRKERNLESVREISTHVAACAAKGLGTDDLARIDLRELRA